MAIAIDEAEKYAEAQQDTNSLAARRLPGNCGCLRCWEKRFEADPLERWNRIMILCPQCGNKRCPHATDHRLACTNSNEPGQPGSAYA